MTTDTKLGRMHFAQRSNARPQHMISWTTPDRFAEKSGFPPTVFDCHVCWSISTLKSKHCATRPGNLCAFHYTQVSLCTLSSQRPARVCGSKSRLRLAPSIRLHPWHPVCRATKPRGQVNTATKRCGQMRSMGFRLIEAWGSDWDVLAQGRASRGAWKDQLPNFNDGPPIPGLVWLAPSGDSLPRHGNPIDQVGIKVRLGSTCESGVGTVAGSVA